MLDKPQAGSDLDPRVLGAYFNQCTAEAQEVTLARAIELKHSASLIAALASETAKLFLAAGMHSFITKLIILHFRRRNFGRQ